MRRSPELSFSATEVAGFLSCRHLTSLELRVAEGELTRPAQNDIERRMLEKRGSEHEARVLAHFRAQGREVLELPLRPGPDGLAQAARETLEAMSGGADLIYQGTLLTPGWVGRPDFLSRVEGGGGRFAHHYEPMDAKLSREPKASAIMQLCAYADQLSELQGVFPRRFHIAPGTASLAPLPLLTADYSAYFRSVRARMAAFVKNAQPSSEPYPEPVEHCTVCRYWKRCEDRRRADDHLSLVAGISRRQRDRLALVGVERLEALAVLDPERAVPGIAADSLSRIREQAAIQLRGRNEGRALYELLPHEQRGVGLEALPLPTPGDLFLDLEGDSFALDDGLEYLFGVLDFGEPELDFTVRDAPGAPRYHAFWAASRAEEKIAFERVIDRIVYGRQEFPQLHVFHFGHREADALKKLSCRHATRENEVDQLLRDGVLVDLLPIVRHALRASVEGYTLKELEVLHGFRRETNLRDAARAMQLFGWWLETGDEVLPLAALKSKITSYNRDDCASTAQLRSFLESLRPQLAERRGAPVPRPEREQEEPPKARSARQLATAALAARLTEAPEHPQAGARRLLADLLEFHWREAKSGYWEYFRARDLAPADRLEDRCAIAELSYVGPVGTIKKSIVHRYSFPEQEHSLRASSSPLDADTRKSPGKVVAIGSRHVDIKRGASSSVPHPRALVVGAPIDTDVLADSLFAFGEALLEDRPGFEAARALLLRQPPQPAGEGTLLLPGELPEHALARLTSALAGGVVAVQGPPGAGKTYQAARMICELLKKGRRVGVTATSHSVIKQLLQRVYEHALQMGLPHLVSGRHLEDDDEDGKSWSFRIDKDKAAARRDLEAGGLNLVGGTAWTWSHGDFASSVDALVVDEAGQMSLANALAVARAAKGLVLFGDPAQLEQPQKGVHPPGAEVSALEHWLGGDALTIPAHLGVFLPKTRRLHPSICQFISNTFYEGRLTTEDALGLERQSVVLGTKLSGAGLEHWPVVHRGNTNQAPEEVEAIVQLVNELAGPSARFQTRDGDTRPLSAADILVVAPYNAQVAALRRALPDDVKVGTVDKFQGREAPVVIYSLTSSSAEDAPRGLEFLFSLNRLNVAVSRAQALCVLVASPELGFASCKTPRQMKLVNALCAYLEAAAPATANAAVRLASP
jgi:predicted RecB family nuclease